MLNRHSETNTSYVADYVAKKQHNYINTLVVCNSHHTTVTYSPFSMALASEAGALGTHAFRDDDETG